MCGVWSKRGCVDGVCVRVSSIKPTRVCLSVCLSVCVRKHLFGIECVSVPMRVSAGLSVIFLPVSVFQCP